MSEFRIAREAFATEKMFKKAAAEQNSKIELAFSTIKEQSKTLAADEADAVKSREREIADEKLAAAQVAKLTAKGTDHDSGSSSGEDDKKDDMSAVKLDTHDCHLDCNISDDGLEFAPLHKDGFQYLWKAARGTHGITGGCYMYEIKIMEYYKCDLPGASSRAKNMVRVGASLPLSSLYLGDSRHSWSWGGTGKKAHDGVFKDFGGQTFGLGDVIGIIMDADNLTLSFTKNGKFAGMAYTDIHPSIQDEGMFPHIMVKNVRIEVNFDKKLAWHQPPKNCFFLSDATTHVRTENPVEHATSQDDCEMIMMIGLPACGKTYWAKQYMEENPRDNFCLVGINSVMEQMKTLPPQNKDDLKEYYDNLLVLATPIFKKMCDLSAKSNRNIILDQTNVSAVARNNKLQDFSEFGERKAVVVVCDATTLDERTKTREWEEGKVVPPEALLQMKQNFVLPTMDEGFTAIEYPEKSEEEAREVIRVLNEQAEAVKELQLTKKKEADAAKKVNALDVVAKRSGSKSLSVPKKNKKSSSRKKKSRSRSRKHSRSRKRRSRSRKDRSRRRHRSDSRSRSHRRRR